MAPLLQELSILEVKPLEVVVPPPESEQECHLDTLTTAPDEAALRTGTVPTNASSCSWCCCCACVCCCA